MPKYDELLARAKELGVPTNSGIYKPQSEAWNELQISEYELHRRIIEEERHQREHKLWLVAAASAIVSVLSMFAAWATVFVR